MMGKNLRFEREKRRRQVDQHRRAEKYETAAAFKELQNSGRAQAAVRLARDILTHEGLPLHHDAEEVRRRATGIIEWCTANPMGTTKQFKWLGKTKTILDALFRGDPGILKRHRERAEAKPVVFPDWMRDRSLLPKKPPGRS